MHMREGAMMAFDPATKLLLRTEPYHIWPLMKIWETVCANQLAHIIIYFYLHNPYKNRRKRTPTGTL